MEVCSCFPNDGKGLITGANVQQNEHVDHTAKMNANPIDTGRGNTKLDHAAGQTTNVISGLPFKSHSQNGSITTKHHGRKPDYTANDLRLT
jgi:hypothetical protein